MSAAVIFKDTNLRVYFSPSVLLRVHGCFWQMFSGTYAARNHLSVNSMPCSLLHFSALDLAWGQRSGVRLSRLIPGQPPFLTPPAPPAPPWHLRADVSPTVTRRTKKKSQRSNHPNIWMLLHAEHFPPPSPPTTPLPPPSVCSQWCLFYRWGHESVSAPSHQQSSSNTHDTGFRLFTLSSSIRRGVSSSAQSGERCMLTTYKRAFFQLL